MVVGYCSGTREFVYGLSTGGCYSNANVAAYLDSGTVTTNIITTGNVSGANIVGSYLYGCGSNVTGITTSNITGLAAVATSGAYSCLSGAPTCLNAFSNGPGYYNSGNPPPAPTLCAVATSGSTTSQVITVGGLQTGGCVSASGNITAANFYTAGSGGNIVGANVISAVTLTATGNVYGCAVFTNNIINASTGNINITGNLLPSSNTFNLGLPTVPWQNAYFGSQSITILDTVSGNLANAVTIENSSGDISMGTAAFTIGALGNGTPVFTIAALSGQIYSNAETIIQNATNSANTTSGSLQTAGGAGIAMDLYVGGNVSIGDVGEDGNIIVDGTTFDSQFTINAIGGNVPAQFILHRHSTTQEPVFAGARSNTDDSTESPVTNGMPLLSIYGAGWTDPDYQLFSAIQLSVDDNGNITGNTSTPGKIVFYTSSDGSTSNLNTALTIRNDQSAEFNGNVTIDQNLVINPVSYSSLYAVNGARAFVNDSNLAAAGNYGSQISGGGGNTTPVWSDGTNWYIG